jgi:two-component sensor histidine kinase
MEQLMEDLCQLERFPSEPSQWFDLRGDLLSQSDLSQSDCPVLGSSTMLFNQYFRSNHHSGLRNVFCEFHQGVITLTGHVSSYFLKQLAQETTRELEIDHRIVNNLQVVERQTKLISSTDDEH